MHQKTRARLQSAKPRRLSLFLGGTSNRQVAKSIRPGHQTDGKCPHATRIGSAALALATLIVYLVEPPRQDAMNKPCESDADSMEPCSDELRYYALATGLGVGVFVACMAVAISMGSLVRRQRLAEEEEEVEKEAKEAATRLGGKPIVDDIFEESSVAGIGAVGSGGEGAGGSSFEVVSPMVVTGSGGKVQGGKKEQLAARKAKEQALGAMKEAEDWREDMMDALHVYGFRLVQLATTVLGLFSLIQYSYWAVPVLGTHEQYHFVQVRDLNLESGESAGINDYVVSGTFAVRLGVLEAVYLAAMVADFLLRVVSLPDPLGYILSTTGRVDVLCLLSPLAAYIDDKHVTVYSVFLLVGQVRWFRILRELETLSKEYEKTREGLKLGPFHVSRRQAGMILAASRVFLFILIPAGIVQSLEFGCILFEDPQLDPRCNADFYDFHLCAYCIVVTFSTVGYGDMYPATGAGRMASMVLIVVMLLQVPVQLASLAHYFTEEELQEDRIERMVLALIDFHGIRGIPGVRPGSHNRQVMKDGGGNMEDGSGQKKKKLSAVSFEDERTSKKSMGVVGQTVQEEEEEDEEDDLDYAPFPSREAAARWILHRLHVCKGGEILKRVVRVADHAVVRRGSAGVVGGDGDEDGLEKLMDDEEAIESVVMEAIGEDEGGKETSGGSRDGVIKEDGVRLPEGSGGGGEEGGSGASAAGHGPERASTTLSSSGASGDTLVPVLSKHTRELSAAELVSLALLGPEEEGDHIHQAISHAEQGDHGRMMAALMGARLPAGLGVIVGIGSHLRRRWRKR